MPSWSKYNLDALFPVVNPARKVLLTRTVPVSSMRDARRIGVRMRVVRLFLVLFICAVPALARADTIPLAGVLSLPSVANIPSETINYDLTVDTSLQQFIGIDGQSHSAFVAVLGGTVLIFTQPANQLVSTINLAGDAFERLLSDPPMTLLEFGVWKPCLLPDPFFCPAPPPDSDLIKKFDLIAFDLHDVRWVETDGPVATPEGSTLLYLLAGAGLALLGMFARTQKYLLRLAAGISLRSSFWLPRMPR